MAVRARIARLYHSSGSASRWLPAQRRAPFVQVQVDRPDGLDTVNGQMSRRPETAGTVMCRSGPVWRKSSHSGSNCVEIAWHQGAEDVSILVRDSKFPGREPLVFTPGEWAAFLERVKTGDFDVLASPAVA
jgi:hypothetical protein